ncbi:hypothetical protein PsorP6_005873 [Peronosclerospora sorghi]|uniref:Uncharacterized protein n=1 Tax=Peronosclerospora sorghi TaxID=230839 RepID=A0ACC0W212_9STRA|nr:hypothetical protein PsorP6_005873 [Peronosclerospora sorghi]
MVCFRRLAVALVAASAVFSSAIASKRDEEQPQDRQDDDDTTSRTTSSTASEPVATWEVEPDGSVVNKQQEVYTSSTRDTRSLAIDEESHLSNVTHSEERDDSRRAENGTSLRLIEPSEYFVWLEDQIKEKGFTPEIVKKLIRISATQDDNEDPETANDWAFAATQLSFKQLFEPNAKSKDDKPFIDAIYNLQIVAEEGVQEALGVLAMLNLIDVPDPEEVENPTMQRASQEDHTHADELLLHLSKEDDLMANLAVAYGTLSGRIPIQRSASSETDTSHSNPDAACEAALSIYHLCAERNVDMIAEEGGERPVEIVRLSDELLNFSEHGFFGEFSLGGLNPLRDENDALTELELYRAIADNPGDELYPQALHRLGETYFFGNPAAHVPPDRERAAHYFRQAADAGYPLAQANYGMLLANGMGINRDVPQALVYFHLAALQNQPFAFHGLGVLYFTGNGVPQNVTRALNYFDKAIALGYAESHSFLGSAYLNGEGGLPVDFKTAFYHFQAAVDGAAPGQSSQAFFNLGVMHFHGIGTPRSCHASMPLIRSVALHPGLLIDLPFSLVKGYECYKKGDYVRAYLHYRLVAELGDEDAQCNAAYLLEHYGESIRKWKWLGPSRTRTESNESVLHEAFTLYSHAAALNDSEAVRKTGECYYEPWPDVCVSNHSHALERFQLAADLGDAQAGYTCGMMLLTGDGVSRDFVAAQRCFAQCSNAAYPRNVPCALARVGVDVLEALDRGRQMITGSL